MSILFALGGVAALAFSFLTLVAAKTVIHETAAAIIFGVGVLCFVGSNIAYRLAQIIQALDEAAEERKPKVPSFDDKLANPPSSNA